MKKTPTLQLTKRPGLNPQNRALPKNELEALRKNSPFGSSQAKSETLSS